MSTVRCLRWSASNWNKRPETRLIDGKNNKVKIHANVVPLDPVLVLCFFFFVYYCEPTQHTRTHHCFRLSDRLWSMRRDDLFVLTVTQLEQLFTFRTFYDKKHSRSAYPRFPQHAKCVVKRRRIEDKRRPRVCDVWFANWLWVWAWVVSIQIQMAKQTHALNVY